MNFRQIARQQFVSTGGAADPFRYPTNHQEWVDWYQYRVDAYHGENYSQELIKALQLFRALDDDGKVIALTRRLHRDIQFVVDIGTAALALGSVTLQPTEDCTPQEAEVAARIWRASQIERFGPMWGRMLVGMGDLHLEAARVAPERIQIVGHDPRTAYIEYDDALGIEITRLIITHQILGEAEVDAYGNVSAPGAMTIHQRTLTPQAIKVERTVGEETPRLLKRTETQVDEAASGPHRLGFAPCVHIPCIPFVDPEHGLWVGHALDRPLAEVDSLMSQISATGDRYGNPKLVVQGAAVDSEGQAISRFGRIINIKGTNSDKASVYYLEPDLAGVAVLAERLEGLLAAVRGTMPEYLFSGSAAGLSGEALQLLATRYVQKYSDIRARAYGGLAKAIHLGVDLALRRPHDPERTLFTVEGPALLPANVTAEVGNIKAAKDAKIINDVDAIKHSQKLGLASKDVSAEEYLAAMTVAVDPPQEEPSEEPDPEQEEVDPVEEGEGDDLEEGEEPPTE